jgi:hypothetical protein
MAGQRKSPAAALWQLQPVAWRNVESVSAKAWQHQRNTGSAINVALS